MAAKHRNLSPRARFISQKLIEKLKDGIESGKITRQDFQNLVMREEGYPEHEREITKSVFNGLCNSVGVNVPKMTTSPYGNMAGRMSTLEEAVESLTNQVAELKQALGEPLEV